MIELFVMLMSILGMAKVAAMEGRSGLLWGSITGVLCLGSMLIPLPFIRVLAAAVVAYVIMFAIQVASKPRAR